MNQNTNQNISFDENAQSLDEIKKLVDWGIFSPKQKMVIYLLINYHFSRRAIQTFWEKYYKVSISNDALRTCALRSASSLFWDQGVLKGGNNDYLCPEDVETLKVEIRERAHMCNALDVIEILDEAQNLKILRNGKAVEFLLKIKSDKLAADLANESITKPSRSWVNGILETIDSYLTFPILIDQKRFLACSFETIRSFFNKFSQNINSGLFSLPGFLRQGG